MGPNSALFKCNPSDYIEKEDFVKRDRLVQLFLDAGSRGYSVGSYSVPCDNLPALRKLLDDRGFFINTPHCTSYRHLLRSVVR